MLRNPEADGSDAVKPRSDFPDVFQNSGIANLSQEVWGAIKSPKTEMALASVAVIAIASKGKSLLPAAEKTALAGMETVEQSGGKALINLPVSETIGNKVGAQFLMPISRPGQLSAISNFGSARLTVGNPNEIAHGVTILESRLAINPVGAGLTAEKGITQNTLSAVVNSGDRTATHQPFTSFLEHEHAGSGTYRFVPHGTAEVRLTQGPTLQPTDGPTKFIFGDDNSIQRIHFNRKISNQELEGLTLQAGYAGLIKDDVLAAQAAAKFEGRTIGFVSQPIERFATQEQMQQNALDGARAYISGDAGAANNYTKYLTENFGPIPANEIFRLH